MLVLELVRHRERDRRVSGGARDCGRDAAMGAIVIEALGLLRAAYDLARAMGVEKKCAG